MRKFLVIMKREYAQVVKKKSFLIMTLLTPVIMAAMMVVPSFLISKGMRSEVETYAVIDMDGHGIGEATSEAMGAYMLNDDVTPAYESTGLFTPDEANYENVYDSLVQLIRERELRYLLVIHPNAYRADSNLLLVTNSENQLTLNRIESKLGEVLSRQRLEASNINLPVDSVLALTASVDLPRQDTKGEYVNPIYRTIAGFVLIMLIYMLIVIDGQSLMQSIIEEKNDRIMEVLVSSATPFQLMTGKVIGTGLAALTQVGIWILAGAIIVTTYGSSVDPAIMRTVFNPATVAAFVMFLISGFLLFSSFFAFIGSVVNNPKEAQSMIMPLIVVLMMPGLMVGMTAMQMPDAGWVQVMSYIPTYTPLVMMMRVCATAPTVEGNPLLSPIMGEAVIGTVLVIIATIVAMWITGRVFRMGILMYGKRPTFPEIMRWVRHS